MDRTRIADIKKELNADFSLLEDQLSTTLHIISIFLKAQKILYIESKNYCEFHLYCLMLPAIFISSMCSVISASFKDYETTPIAISFMTAFNSFILTLITYLKLDAQAEAHKTSAYSFDQLQSLCEFTTGKISLSNGLELQSNSGTVTYNVQYVHDFIDQIESKVKEIKEKNQFVIPKSVRLKFPKSYYTNIFTKVKEIQIQEMILLNRIKMTTDIENYDISNNETGALDNQTLKAFYNKRRTEIENFVDFKKAFLSIDNELVNEIKKNSQTTNISCFNNCFTPKEEDDFIDMLKVTEKN